MFSMITLGRARVAFAIFLLGLDRLTLAFLDPHLDGPEVKLLRLRREVVPLKHKDKVVSYKTAYSGVITVGNPNPQVFRVVFDTGSGHVVLPSIKCEVEGCLRKTRYDIDASETGTRVNMDGKAVARGDTSDQVTIGFGTGKVKGEIVREELCLGGNATWRGACASTSTVMAVMLSTNPFAVFPFDGIVGLGLPGLAISKDYSFFDLLSNSGQLAAPHFGFFLTEGDGGEESELALGGHNPARLASPLQWAPVVEKNHGHWMIDILGIRVGDQRLDICDDGSCVGVIDSGTSHIGVPSPHDAVLGRMLTVQAEEDTSDCRVVDAPDLVLELRGFNVTLRPDSYMRRLPLRRDAPLLAPTAHLRGARSTQAAAASPAEGAQDSVFAAVSSVQFLGGDAEKEIPPSTKVCSAKLMNMNVPMLGAKMFLLGEPLLQRYYAVFDWEQRKVGLGVAARQTYVEKGHSIAAGTQIV